MCERLRVVGGVNFGVGGRGIEGSREGGGAGREGRGTRASVSWRRGGGRGGALSGGERVLI